MNTDVDSRIREALEASVERTPMSSARDASDFVRRVMNRRRRRRRARNLVIGSAVYVASIAGVVALVHDGNETPTPVGNSNPSTTVSNTPPTTATPVPTSPPTTATTVPTPKPIGFSGEGVGGVTFGGPASQVEAALVASLGRPTFDSGWAFDGCAEKQARTLKWDALEIRFMDDGSGANLIGWVLERASGERPAAIRISPDVDFETTWPQLQSLGAVWEEGYDVWHIADGEGQLSGELSTDVPSDSGTVSAIGGGVTGFLGC